jgi:putative RNA 2'-phosphotransferase
LNSDPCPGAFDASVCSTGVVKRAYLIAIRYERRDWMNIERDDIEGMLAETQSNRFEIVGTRIRASYGHSITLEKPPASAVPPEFLFHGTVEERIPAIMAEGLLRMGRRFVHLSFDMDWVLRFLANKPRWVVLRISAREAHQKGVCFRQANSHVWLVDSVCVELLSIQLRSGSMSL